MLKGLKTFFSPTWKWTSILVCIAILVTLRLGVWQLDRLHQEQVFNDHLKEVLTLNELTLPGDPSGIDLGGMEYRAIVATGKFDYANQVAIRNQVWIQTWGNELGYTLLTPLIMQSGQVVMVQRGWIPLEYNTPESWHVFDGSEEATIRGVIRLPLGKGEMGGGVPDPTNAPGQGPLFFWNYINIARLQEQIPFEILPVYIQQSEDRNQDLLPYRSDPTPQPKEGSHLGYAIQWFVYSAFLIFGYPYFINTRRKTDH
jgi:surfeit locus 1 family protein